MKRVAIVTITNSGLNCGNRLQNHALQVVLQRQGAQVETIYSAKALGGNVALSAMRRAAKAVFRSSARRRCFNAFNRKYIRPAANIRYEGLNENRFAAQYDAFVTGSDQVWNPTFWFNSSFEYLTFAPQHKRFSYAASFGVDVIPEKDRQSIAGWLAGMQEISVREEQGARIAQQLCGRTAHVHIDPTMLLQAEEYSAIEEKPKAALPEKYLLSYYLGHVTNEYKQYIQNKAKALGLAVVELSEEPGTPYYNIGPQHFLYLFHHADYVCTDSFHGTIFSILFHRLFTVFPRRDENQSMNSRIETLMEKTGLASRVYSEGTQPPEQIDYAAVELRIAAERERAQEYFDAIAAQW